MGSLIRTEDITKSYIQENQVLKGINLEIQEGEFVSILGESGSGKTTLLSILGGMETPTTGKVFFKDLELSNLKEKELANLRRTEIGFVFQFFNLAPYLNVEENIFLPLVLDGKNKKVYMERFNSLVETLQIKDILDKFPSNISGGEQQRVAICKSLIYSPELILLDEPTGNLDSKNANEIMVLLRDINETQGTTIIQVTHSEQNAQFGDRIIRILDGQIIEDTHIEKIKLSKKDTKAQDPYVDMEQEQEYETKEEMPLEDIEDESSTMEEPIQEETLLSSDIDTEE